MRATATTNFTCQRIFEKRAPAAVLNVVSKAHPWVDSPDGQTMSYQPRIGLFSFHPLSLFAWLCVWQTGKLVKALTAPIARISI